jgi:hypothetical protein
MLEVLKRVTTPNSRCDTGMFRGCAAHITAQVEHGASAVTAAKPFAECVTCGNRTLPGPWIRGGVLLGEQPFWRAGRLSAGRADAMAIASL